jgi:hypothetical protein
MYLIILQIYELNTKKYAKRKMRLKTKKFLITKKK